MANEKDWNLSEQVEIAKAQAWAHADAQAALEAVRWTFDRFKAGNSTVLFGKRLITGVKESAEAYLVAKEVIQGAVAGGITQLELNVMREKFEEEVRVLFDREIKNLAKTREPAD